MYKGIDLNKGQPKWGQLSTETQPQPHNPQLITMTKKRKSKSNSAKDNETLRADRPDSGDDRVEEEVVKHQQHQHAADDSSSDDSSSDDDSLVLEGVAVRNPDASDSDDDDDSVSSEEEDAAPTKKKAKSNINTKSDTSNKPKKSKKKSNEPDTIQVEFLFCDMNEKFFHGIKTLVHHHSIHSPHSSQLADLILGNVAVGTVLSTDDPNATPPQIAKTSKSKSDKASTATPLPQDDPNVFAFASIINLTAHNSSPCIQSLKQLCLKHCPSQHKSDLETVLSGKTKRPAGFLFQERMVNVPLEITEELHKQLVLDMDWAVKNAEGGDEERKSLDFGAFVRLAPCYGGSGGGGGAANSLIYKYFDDEVFATNAEFVFSFEAPKMFEGDEEGLTCGVIVMTKTGHRAAMKELGKMINGK